MRTLNDYPEHEKLKKVQDESQAIGEFLEWVNYEKRYSFCYVDRKTEQWYPILETKEQLLAEFYDINLDAIEKEKRAMLEEMRQANKR